MLVMKFQMAVYLSTKWLLNSPVHADGWRRSAPE